MADIRTKRAANAQTIYRIGSVTKSFTGVMLQQLLQRGAIHLHDSVVRYLPEFGRVAGRPKGAPPVTVLQLATMTAGLPAEPREEGAFWTGRADRWESKLLAALPHSRFEAPPGERFAYSNLGYATLGAALARAAKMPFIQWQQTRILAPLGMRHTWFEYEPSMNSDLATGYVIGANGALDDSTAARELHEGRGYKVPAGAIFTTVGDLARFVSFQLGKAPESVLSHARLDSTYSGTVATSAEMDMGYGLGFMAQRRDDFPWVGHSGGVPGYTAVMYFDRDHQIGVIILRNATGGRVRIGRVAPDMLRVLIDAKLEAARR
ncbi:MAG: beta-lactamase family protein [Gemmatimonadaceae bacterium]|nr:beta-lactamase family protein [Gemmatimonadaceae bacterium]